MFFIRQIKNYLAPYPLVRQFIKFSIVGSTAASIHFLLLYFFTERVGWWYIYSNAIGFIISASFNFTSNKLWTFRNIEKGLAIARQIFKFGLVLGTGLLITTIIIYGLTEWVGLDYRVSWFFAVAVVALWNFSLNRWWTFRIKQSPVNRLDSSVK